MILIACVENVKQSEIVPPQVEKHLVPLKQGENGFELQIKKLEPHRVYVFNVAGIKHMDIGVDDTGLSILNARIATNSNPCLTIIYHWGVISKFGETARTVTINSQHIIRKMLNLKHSGKWNCYRKHPPLAFCSSRSDPLVLLFGEILEKEGYKLDQIEQRLIQECQ